jgi:hypothetical protein
MSKLKISENLFLEVAELNRLVKFLDDDGFKRHFLINTDSFGLVKQFNISDIGNVNIEDCFYVEKSGTPFDEVTINKGIAVDLSANLIINNSTKNLKIPNDGLWYWIKIKHKFSNNEIGKLSIDNLGNVVGVNTEFTKIFRGQPNFPTKIKFLNSVNGNSDIYEVVKVIDDNNMILQGDFINENNLEFAVHGTFTPGFVVDNDKKLIYNYDNVEISLVGENLFNEQPNFIFNKEFYIARVKNNGVNLSLEDKRTNWWQTEAVNMLKNLDRNLENPLIGVENLKWDVKTSTRAKNWVELAFGFRFSSFTIDTSSKRISILIGQGGVYKDTSFFQNGDFTGWRLYSKNGKHQTIIDSIKTGTQIVVTLDVLDIDDYTSGDLLFITPPFEEIEIRVRRDGAILDVNDANQNSITNEAFPFPNIEEIHNFSINTPLARFQIPAPDGCYLFNLTYRYKIFNEYSDWQSFPDDYVGLYKELSFDDYGNLNPEPIDRERLPYSGHPENGFIKVCEHIYSFNNFQEEIDTGDKFGVFTRPFSAAEPLINLVVGLDKKYQHFKGNEYTMENDIYINLSRNNVKGVQCREGNTFYIHIEQFINQTSFKIRIVEDYVNPVSNNLIAELTENDLMYIRNNFQDNSRNGLFITCTFNDLGHWICHFDTDVTPKGTVRMLVDIPSNSFNSTGFGIKKGYWGWKIMDINSIIGSTNNPNQTGQEFGTNDVTIGINNIPEHDHLVGGRRADRNTSGSGYAINQVHIGNYDAGGSAQTRTSKAGGSTNPAPIQINPKHIRFLTIKKIV